MDLDTTFEDVSTPERKRATYADLEALPENVLGQLIDGELIASPRPAFSHGTAISRLHVNLGGTFEQGLSPRGGWWFVFEPELHLGEDVLVPDLAGWRGALRPERSRAWSTVAPAWICEVLSPSTAKLDRERKLPIYAREGVEHAWLIDPEARSLEVFRRSATGWELAGSFSGDARVRAEPFDAIELELGQLWV